MKSIVVTIENGQAIVQTSGFSGGACMKETEDLKAALGVVERETPTAEMHQIASVAQTQRAGR